MNWLAVGLGGALGAMMRYGLAVWLGQGDGKFPFATFIANVLGCFIMGFLFVMILDRQIISELWRPVLMVGFLGALTTFSTFSLETLKLWQGGHVSLALVYMASSVLCCLIAVWAGYISADILYGERSS